MAPGPSPCYCTGKYFLEDGVYFYGIIYCVDVKVQLIGETFASSRKD